MFSKNIFQTALYTLVFVSLFSKIEAQNQDDALRYSFFQPVGTARFNGLGGAFTSLGGDVSAINQNPASIGVFRKSEVSFTPFYSYTTNKAEHYGTSTTNYDSHLKVANFSLVLSSEPHNGRRWQSSNFGISFNKLADYSNDITISGQNDHNSLLDVYKYDIERGNYNTYGSNLAWEMALIDTLTGRPDSFFSRIPEYREMQTATISTKGDLRETAITYGANYDDKLYIGASIGFLRARYTRTNYYSETLPENDTTTILKSFNIQDQLSSAGNGVRASIGLIYRPFTFMRLGLSAQSASALSMNESWNTTISADYGTIGKYSYSPDPGSFNYSVRTPARYNAGLSFLINKYGLVSFDYEYVDYRSMLLKSIPRSTYSFSGENAAIAGTFKAAQNLRMGAEMRVQRFSFRVGVSHMGNMFKDINTNDYSVNSYSGGIGYRDKVFYSDLSITSRTSTQKYYLYDSAFIKPSLINTNQVIGALTVGIRF